MAGEVFAPLLTALPEAMLLVDAEGEIAQANPAAAALLAGARTLPPGLRLGDFAVGHGLAAFLRAAARSGQIVPGAITLRDPAGAERAFRAEGAVLQPRNAAGNGLLLVRLVPKEAAVSRFAALNLRIEELNREIARRRQAEEALRDERELLRVTLASIGDAVIATDRTGRITFLNAVAEAQTGWPRAEAIGRPLDEVFVIVNEDTRTRVENPVDRVLRENVVVGLANHTLLIRRDGEAVPIDDAGAPIRTPAGAVLGVVLVFRDVSERRALERERVQAERRKDEFLAMLAHELRNPLAAIGSGVEVVRRSAGGGISTVTEAMHRQVRHLARLVDDLLDVSRITTGRITLQRQAVELNAVVEQTLATHRPAVAAQNLSLSWEASPAPLMVHGDPERLGQVVDNLLSNAIKFNRPGGSVLVATDVQGDCARLRVADTGEGIEPQLMDSLFELFVQGDKSLARSRGGLGVGLAVARLITELHGGRIEAASAGPGQGAQFTVLLPLAVVDASAATRAEARPKRAERRRILVVDDNVDAALTLAKLLELSGQEVRVAHDGGSALQIHAQWPAEVVLLDLGMPGMDGYEIARRLRGMPATPRARIIALTGYGAHAERARVMATGFDGHLIKPVEMAALERLLAS